jgi:hypothetical protein
LVQGSYCFAHHGEQSSATAERTAEGGCPHKDFAQLSAQGFLLKNEKTGEDARLSKVS